MLVKSNTTDIKQVAQWVLQRMKVLGFIPAVSFWVEFACSSWVRGSPSYCMLNNLVLAMNVDMEAGTIQLYL